MPKTEQTPQAEPTTSQKVWRFVEKYYPNYTHSDEIAHSDVLERILEGQLDREVPDDTPSKHFDTVRRDTDTDAQAMAQIQVERNELLADIYERSIEAFLEQQPKPVTILKTYYFGKDVCREQDKGRATSEIEECIANGELLGSVIDKEFKTEAEMLSYEEGLEDASGWEISTYQDQAP